MTSTDAVRYAFLCCSDTHDRALPDVPDAGSTAWLHAGDVCSGENQDALKRERPLSDELREWAQARKAAVAGWMEARSIPVFCVQGNHDATDPWAFFRSCEDVGSRVVRIAPQLVLAGVGWCGGRYYDTPGEADIQTVCTSVRRQATRILRANDRLVLLTHYPPQLPQASHFAHGLRAVGDLIIALHPIAVVHGHTHVLSAVHSMVTLDQTQVLVVNPGHKGGILTIDVVQGVASFACMAK